MSTDDEVKKTDVKVRTQQSEETSSACDSS